MKKIFCVLAGALSLLVAMGGQAAYAANADPAYMENYTSGGAQDYIEITDNTLENPLPMIKGVERVFYFDFTDLSQEEYDQLKNNYLITVYDNDDQTVSPSQPILTPGYIVPSTIWDDGMRRAVMQYKANRNGEAKIVLYDKSKMGSKPRDIIFVKVFDENKIYIKDKESGKYYLHDSYTDYVEKGDTVETLVVMRNIAANDSGAMHNPSSYPYSGMLEDSNFSSEEEWTKLGNGNWALKSTVTKKTDNRTPLYVYKNVDPNSGYRPAADTAYIQVMGNDIVVKEVAISDRIYSDINKNLATRMLSGKTGVNSWSNQYISYVSEGLELKSLNENATHFESTDETILAKKSEDGDEATFIGKKPGNCVILLKNDNGNVVEVMYVTVQYKIEVEADGKRTNKDCIHEYLPDTQSGRYAQFPDIYIHSDQLKPLYEKNIFWTGYWMKPGDTVTLVSYADVNDPASFRLDDQFEAAGEPKVEELSGDKEGFKSVTQTVKLKDNSVQIQAVHFGQSGGYEEHFFVNDEAVNVDVSHMDIEIDDNGAAELIEEQKLANGTTKRTITKYKVNVSKNYGSKAYNEAGEVVMELDESAYWSRIYNEGHTQFESTSAYITNGENELVDLAGNVITEEVEAGIMVPVWFGRHVPLADIKKVEFTTDLKLTAVSKVEQIVRGDEVVSSKNLDASGTRTINGYIIEFEGDEITKARNKCPGRNGLDFAVSLSISLPPEEVPPVNPDTATGSVTMVMASLIGFSAIIACLGASNKRR